MVSAWALIRCAVEMSRSSRVPMISLPRQYRPAAQQHHLDLVRMDAQMWRRLDCDALPPAQQLRLPVGVGLRTDRSDITAHDLVGQGEGLTDFQTAPERRTNWWCHAVRSHG